MTDAKAKPGQREKSDFELDTYKDYGKIRACIIKWAKICLEKDAKGIPTKGAMGLLIAWTEDIKSKKTYHDKKAKGNVSDHFRAAVLACMVDEKLMTHLGGGDARDRLREAIKEAEKMDGELNKFKKELEDDLAHEKKHKHQPADSSSSVDRSPPSTCAI